MEEGRGILLPGIKGGRRPWFQYFNLSAVHYTQLLLVQFLTECTVNLVWSVYRSDIGNLWFVGMHREIRPIIGIGRFLCQYRPIVIYYVLWWHWILKLYFLIWKDDTNFRFYPRDAMLARVIEIATCLSVRPSVCPSRAGIVSKRRMLAAWFLHHLVAPRL